MRLGDARITEMTVQSPRIFIRAFISCSVGSSPVQLFLFFIIIFLNVVFSGINTR